MEWCKWFLTSDLIGLMKGGFIMKSSHKVDRFDYSKFESKFDNWYSPELSEYEFWGIHPKNGRLRIDTKRYKEMCEGFGITDFMPEGLFKNRETVYFLPAKRERYDYKVNIFRDLLSNLAKDWNQEYKPIFDKIKTPKQVEDNYRVSELVYTSCSDDYDEICVDAMLAGIKREPQYRKIINSLYCQFISKISTEVDRFTLIVMTDLGYKGTDYDFQSFCKFSDGLLNDKNGIKMRELSKFNSYNMLHKINNFLKHNSLEAYRTLKRLYPQNVVSKDNGATCDYENGMFAGDWLILKPGYIDKLLPQLIQFFEDYCRVYLKEDLEESKWNYDDYFRNAFKELSNPIEYFGLPC